MKRLIALCIAASFLARAEAAPVDFGREVRPIFEKHCSECHGEKKQKSGLRLDVKAAALKGGDNHGPNIIPGKARESSLIHLVTSRDEDEVMPPKGERLSAAQIATLTAWINEGAVWPDGVDGVKLEDKTDHWSFKPLRVVSASSEMMRLKPQPLSIDAFIDAKLAEKGLQRSPPADPVSWLRRVTFDLTGLPPTPEDVEAFLQEPDHAAAVERLLASPRYGERWAQHWLDVVRYADTHGFEVNTERPTAWPYRDYVIDALNADTPYDQFIREQLAGDATGKDAATGFLVTASVLLPGQIGKDDASKRLARQDAIDEIVNNIGQTFLGLSVGCARCHDHKFDPITAEDYDSMQAFVAGVEYQERDLRTPEAAAARAEAARLRPRLVQIDRELARFVPVVRTGAERPMVNARENTDRIAPAKARQVRFTIRATNTLEPCLDELEVFDSEGENIALASAGATVTSSGDTIVADRHDLKHLNDGKYGNTRSWMSNEKGRGWVIVEFPREQTIERIVWGRDRDGKYTDRLAIDYEIEVADASGAWRSVADARDRRKFDARENKAPAFTTKGLTPEDAAQAAALISERRPLEATVNAAAAQKVFAGTFREPDVIRVLNRGDPEQPKEEVVPAVPRFLGDVKLTRTTPEQQRRLTLADWIARPQNPLTARVMVNRIWQGHFGTGLVATPSDFGHSTLKPSHPELLDWLAQEFIRSGWSIKHLHRRIVLSETYRQSGFGSSQTDAAKAAATLDSEMRLLWRYPSRRLEAETIRDAMLAVSGRLSLKMYGRGYDLFDKRGGLSGFEPVASFTGDGLRRMIYAHKVRRESEAVFGAFDCPDAGQSSAVRRTSTTPIQALNLFNSRFTLEQSEALAARVRKETGEDVAAQIRRAFRLALSREPSADELRDLEPTIRRHGLPTLCRALFNTNEFLFVP